MNNPRGLRAQIVFLSMFVVSIGVYGCGAILQSVEKDKEMGRQTAEVVKNEMGFYEDAELAGYLDRVGQRLVKADPDQIFEYRFEVVDQYEPNAFALPGGYIYVSRGLLALSNNEAELAGVLAHEIIHVSRRHSARQMAKARVPALLSLPGAVVGGLVNQSLGNLINAPVYAIGGAYLASHSRQDEFESDRLGQQLAASAGYDPAALGPLLAHLEDFSELQTGEQRIPGFFDTHPSTPDRVERVARDAAQIQWRPRPAFVGDSAAYLHRLEGLLVGEDPAMGQFKGRQFLHPDLDISVTFPEGWKGINTRRAVVALSPQEDAMLALGIAAKGTDPDQAADAFEKAFYEEYQVKPNESKSMKIGDLPAHLTVYTDRRGKEPMHLSLLWIAYSDLIYQILGLSPDKYRQLIEDTAYSFRPLTVREKASIEEIRMRLVAARANETLTALSKRSQNVWDLKTTAVINGIGASGRLTKGQLVKIGVEQPYKAKQ